MKLNEFKNRAIPVSFFPLMRLTILVQLENNYYENRDYNSTTKH